MTAWPNGSGGSVGYADIATGRCKRTQDAIDQLLYLSRVPRFTPAQRALMALRAEKLSADYWRLGICIGGYAEERR